MADEIMMSIAAALAGKAADTALGAAKGAWGQLVRLVRERLGRDHDAAAATALEAAQLQPTDEAAIQELASALEQTAAADPGFGAELIGLWPKASAELTASENSVKAACTSVTPTTPSTPDPWSSTIATGMPCPAETTS